MKFDLKRPAGKAKPHTQMMVLAAGLPMLWGVDLPGVIPTSPCQRVHAVAGLRGDAHWRPALRTSEHQDQTVRFRAVG